MINVMLHNLTGHHADVGTMPITVIVDRIETLNRNLARFWHAADGWAPIEAAGLLSKSRLDRQVSLSSTLRLWTGQASLSDGELILGWTNLGSLLEGTMKLLLSAYYENYRADVENLKATNAFNHKKQEPTSPDALALEVLRQYFELRGLLNAKGDALVALVQQRRNAIHAFKDRPIGDHAEFEGAVRGYLEVLRAVNARLPYPNDIYVPRAT